MARNPGADAAEEAQPVLEPAPAAGGGASEFDVVAFVRSREARLCHEWLAASGGEEGSSGEEAAVFGALVDALEPNGGWWLDVTAETLVEAGVKTNVIGHQLEVLTEVISARIAAEHGAGTSGAVRAQLSQAAQDLVAACGRRSDNAS